MKQNIPHYWALYVLINVNIFFGCLIFCVTMIDGVELINHYWLMRDALAIIRDHIILGFLFLSLFFGMGYLLNWLRRLNIEADYQHNHLPEQSVIQSPDGLKILRIVAIILTIIGIGFALLASWMLITYIFNNPADSSDCNGYNCPMISPAEWRWIMITTWFMILGLILCAFNIGQGCKAVYKLRMKIDVSEFNLIHSPILFRGISFLGLLLGSLVSGIGTGIAILIVINDIFTQKWLFSSQFFWTMINYGISFGLIWLLGFWLIGLGLIFHHLPKILFYIRYRRNILKTYTP